MMFMLHLHITHTLLLHCVICALLFTTALRAGSEPQSHQKAVLRALKWLTMVLALVSCLLQPLTGFVPRLTCILLKKKKACLVRSVSPLIFTVVMVYSALRFF